MRQVKWLLAEATIILATAWCSPADGTEPLFMGLGDLPGGSFLSTASDVSADGSVVVGSSANANGRLNCCRGGPATVTLRSAFRWTEERGMVALGTLSESNLAASFASAISADGSTVVGNSGAYTASSSGRPPQPPRIVLTGSDAFRWRSGPGMVNLGTDTNAANAVSANGRIVVGNRSSNSGNEAFLWQQGSGISGLGDLPGGGFASSANGVSADGSVVVGLGRSDAGNEAFRWTQSAGMVGLGDLPGGAFASVANEVSADGFVVVGNGSSDSGNEAFRWTQASGMVGLGDLPGGTFGSFANDVSADGSIVVGYGSTDLGSEAFVWDANRGMRNLREVLVNHHGLAGKLNGWRLSTANGVSADGQVIVGQGINPGGFTEAWLARLGTERLLPGDFNVDGSTDAADYVVWRKSDGTHAGYDAWRTGFGRTAGSGATSGANTAIPEPQGLIIVVAGLIACFLAIRSPTKPSIGRRAP